MSDLIPYPVSLVEFIMHAFRFLFCIQLSSGLYVGGLVSTVYSVVIVYNSMYIKVTSFGCNNSRKVVINLSTSV